VKSDSAAAGKLLNEDTQNKPKATPPPSSDQASDTKDEQLAPAPDSRGGKRPTSSSWFATHGRDLRFLLVFGMLMGVYYWGTTTEVVSGKDGFVPPYPEKTTLDDGFFPWYLERTTSAASGVLHVFRYKDVAAEGTNLIGSVGSISVARGCDAVAPTALFLSAVLASPASIGSKFLAVICGTLILMVVNLIRIITLFLTAVYWPKIFDALHLDVWQAVFIFLAILLWAFWASWASRRRKRRSHATA
jgi:exosortase/archaeosortase family protein